MTTLRPATSTDDDTRRRLHAARQRTVPASSTPALAVQVLDRVTASVPAGPAARTAVLRLVPQPPRVEPSGPVGPGALPPPTGADRALRRRRTGPCTPGGTAGADDRPTTADPSVDPTSFCGSLALAAVEALSGIRPLAQLARWVSPTVYERTARRAAITAPRGEPSPPARRPTVRRIRVFRLGPGAVEASVVIADGDRVRAVAVRIEPHRGAWRAEDLIIG
ncbi:MAG TPA: Rv3235 family protein [Cellulomonas sp.]